MRHCESIMQLAIIRGLIAMERAERTGEPVSMDSEPELDDWRALHALVGDYSAIDVGQFRAGFQLTIVEAIWGCRS